MPEMGFTHHFAGRAAGSGKLVFGDWNHPVALRAPAAAVDVEHLLRQS